MSLPDCQDNQLHNYGWATLTSTLLRQDDVRHTPIGEEVTSLGLKFLKYNKHKYSSNHMEEEHLLSSSANCTMNFNTFIDISS